MIPEWLTSWGASPPPWVFYAALLTSPSVWSKKAVSLVKKRLGN